MTSLFVEFDELTATAGGLIASGPVPIAEAVAAAGDLPVNEMAGSAAAGKLLGCTVARGVLRVVAEIRESIAVRKCAERVYRGLCLVGTIADGALTIIGAALVDCPGALSKRAGARPPALSLHMQEMFKMSLHNPVASSAAALGALGIRPAPFMRMADDHGRPYDPRAIRASQEDAFQRFLRDRSASNLAVPANDAAFLQWYAQKADR